MTLTCSAPGKVLIAGEYAVLEGHPALVASVDRRARATLTPGDELTVGGLGLGPLRAQQSAGSVLLDGDDGRLGLLRAVLQVATERGVPLPRGHLAVDTSEFYENDEKLGLGSSAAVAAAVAGLLLGTAGDVDEEEVHELAAAAHERFSDGRGSGVDVAASSYGGIIRFERIEGAPQCHTWPLAPRELVPVVVYVGEPASTRELLAKVDKLRAAERKRYDERIADIAWAALELLDAVSPDEDPRVFVAAMDRCRRAMRRLGDKVGVDIVSPPHRRVAKLARLHGGSAKPSGAGVGDVAIAFVPGENEESFSAALEAEGFLAVECELGVEGVRLE
jgi:mevalonate kinase